MDRYIGRLTFLMSFIFLISFSGVYAAPGSVVDLAPHRVVYDLHLSSEAGSGSSGSGLLPSVIAARGRMVVRLTGSSCMGWQTDLRSFSYFLRSFGDVQLIDWSMKSWESGDGLRLDFTSDRFVNGRRSSARGSGEILGLGLSGQVTFDYGGGGDFLLRSGTLFPVGHTLSILSSARSGDIISRSTVYEGSQDNDVYRAVTFIGPHRIGVSSSFLSSFPFMREMSSWFISTSYFDEAPSYLGRFPDAADDLGYDPFAHPGERFPVHRLEATLYDNGVFDNLVFDYGDFVLRAVLSDIEFIPPAKCDS